MLQCWHLVRILVRTDHPCLGVGCHINALGSPAGAAWTTDACGPSPRAPHPSKAGQQAPRCALGACSPGWPRPDCAPVCRAKGPASWATLAWWSAGRSGPGPPAWRVGPIARQQPVGGLRPACGPMSSLLFVSRFNKCQNNSASLQNSYKMLEKSKLNLVGILVVSYIQNTWHFCHSCNISLYKKLWSQTLLSLYKNIHTWYWTETLHVILYTVLKAIQNISLIFLCP
jgi:hypothetical protein